MLKKKYAEVEKSICVSCGACTQECPLGAISIYKGCYAVVDKEKCVGCGKCAKVCPTGAITVREL